MVMRVDVMVACMESLDIEAEAQGKPRARRALLTPQGKPFAQAAAVRFAAEPAIMLICGRYEGFDERIVEHFCSEQLSIGRYVLAGGELAAMVVCDAVMRKLPGVLGKDESALEESFSPALGGAPEYPHYTRPAEWRGWRVPDVLLSGHHENVRRWRAEQSRRRAGDPLP
jgi:tRNA (guanine37-N1)-methyltransferase